MDELDQQLDDFLRPVDQRLREQYPGDPGTRQPVHTVYIPADQYHGGIVGEWGAAARELLRTHGRLIVDATQELGLDPLVVAQVLGRVRSKLEREPIEDLRIDFEDGYGSRPDEEEDRAATEAAHALARGTRTPFTGIRFKSLELATRRRGLRTLDLFLGTFTHDWPPPERFVVTLPKVSAVEQVEAMVKVCEAMEAEHGMSRLSFELQIELPQAILGADGTATVARMIHAAAGRCTGLHYGTYDYSAAAGVAAAYQSMEHPAADHAKAVMQVAAAGTGVRLSDGSTNRLPTGDEDAVKTALREHLRLVLRSLSRGFYQGWDLHPGQLPTRYVATFAFFRGGFPEAADRLRAYVGRQASGFLDEPATAAALAGFLRRGLHCGALDEGEVHERTGLDAKKLAALATPR
jgi:citrate lyase beta subunit